MITILHGDNIEASRAEFMKIQQAGKGAQIRWLDTKSIDPTALYTALTTPAMEGEKVLVIVENFFSGRKKKPDTLFDIQTDAHVIIWEGRELEKALLSKLAPSVSVKLFRTPPAIFEFLDKLTLESFQKAVGQEPPELIFTLLVRRVRQLLMLSGGTRIGALAPWQEARLTRQGRSFTMEKLYTMHNGLLDLEYALKTGASPFSLTELLQQWIINL